jgi:hypothetical protein
VNRDEAFKVVKHLEDVLSAWNEYRLALSQAGKAGKKLAGAMRDLAGCMDKTDVSGGWGPGQREPERVSDGSSNDQACGSDVRDVV